MEIALPYGKGKIFPQIPDFAKVRLLESQRGGFPRMDELEVKESIEKAVKEYEISGKTVSIAIPDQTRPNVSKYILPPLVETLLKKEAKEIRICVGTGLHRKATEKELEELVPIKKSRVRVFIHDARKKETLTFIGKTSFSTPIWIMKYFAEADLKIVVSIVEEHQFAGFSGGAKGVAIGLGGEETVRGNHSKLTSPYAKMGLIEGNPVREEIDEVGNMVGLDLLINTVLNENKEIIKLFVGSHPSSHREACQFVKESSGVPVRDLYDIVIVSPGGYPRDIDLYQSQKALAVAQEFCKPGGKIILLAECSQGFGDEGNYVQILEKAPSPVFVLDNFDFSNFQVGPHKAFLLARTLSKHEVFIISSLPKETLRRMF
ncbi:nickel-dependent lactate racemase, partial [Thermotoga sp.]|uniref:nickel-dependent lactate racemase n=1 Tax=Thermotoga sp. TaxID=28240 RepID=UPI0025D32E8B